MKKWLGQSCALLLVVSMLMNGMAQPVLAQNGNERTAQEQAEYSGGGIEGEAEAAPEETPNALRKTETGALGEQASPSKAGKKQADSSDVLPDGRVLDDTASPANAGLNLLSLLARSLTGEKPITYRYEAKDAMGRNIPSAEIPQAILGTCPGEKSEAVGETVHPEQPVIPSEVRTTPYKDREGTWSFKGWDRQSLTVAEESEQNVFVGSWTFRDKGFCKSEYLSGQTLPLDMIKKFELGKIVIKIKVERLSDLPRPDPEPFHLPKTYVIRAYLADDNGRPRLLPAMGKQVGIGTFVEESREPASGDPNVYTVTGCLKDSYGKNVTFPLFDENGVGISYQVQEDTPYQEGGKGEHHHHRWSEFNSTPGHWFRQESQERNVMTLRFTEGYTEYVSAEFRSTWLTGMPEAQRPVMRAQLPFKDGEDFDPPIDTTYVPLLKKNHKDDPENYVRARTDRVGNESWFRNFKENEEKHEFGLVDAYDLRAPLDVTLEGLDSDGFITKDGHRFKSSITYDPYKGALATFQEEYQVTFHSEEGKFSDGTTEDKKYPCLHGENLSEEAVKAVKNPTREGFRFGGWRVGSADSEEHFDPGASITRDMDLYAKWEEKPIVVTTEPQVPGAAGQGTVPDSAYRKLTFHPNEGEFGSGDQPVTYWILKNKSFAEARAANDGRGELILKIPEAGKRYAKWMGWGRDRSKGTATYNQQLENYTQDADSTENVTLYAIYQEKPIVVKTEPKIVVESKVPGAAWQGEVSDPDYRKLTFDPNGGKFGSGDQPVTYWILKNKSFGEAKAAKDGNGELILRIPEAAKHDAKWLGWGANGNKTTVAYNQQLAGYEQAAGSTEDVILHAIYEPKPIVVTTEPKVPDAAGQGEVSDSAYRKLTFHPNGGKFGSNAHPVTYWILKNKSFADAKAVLDGGNPILRIPEAAQDNADWLGWDRDGNQEKPTYGKQLEGYRQEAGSTENVTFYAIYKEKSGTDPGTQPGTDPGTKPGTDPGTKPGTDPGTQPGTKPGTEPGNDQPGTNEPETKPGHSSSGGGHSSGGGGSIRGRGRKPSQGVTQPREQTPPAPVTPTSPAAPGGAVAPSSPAAPTSAVSPTDSIGSADSNGLRETAAEAPAPEEAAAVPGAPRRLPRTGEHGNRLLWTIFLGLVSLSLLVFGMKRKHK